MLPYKPQLDSLRALAVSAVLLGHFAGVPIGIQGVELFFVLSGFLITRILIDGKSQFERRPTPKLLLLRQFYVRRFLRIFPPYYMLLLGLVLIVLLSSKARSSVGDVSFWQSIWFHATYTSNFWFAFTGRWDPWVTSHFWSLAIEEQFYLFWPWIIISVSKRSLWIAATVLCALAPLFRGTMLIWGASNIAFGTLTPTYFDFLGLGGLLAVVWGNRRAHFILRSLGGIAMVILALNLIFEFTTVNNAMTLWALAFTALVSKAAEGFGGPVGSFLNWGVLRYLGRISYGIYLYHLPVLLVWTFSQKLGVRLPDVGAERFVIAGMITVLLAATSWHFYERPINDLKRFFPYRDSEGLRPRLEHDFLTSSRDVA
jgi:peptidoglycan/LPS O-acetylase OafA/YrhL